MNHRAPSLWEKIKWRWGNLPRWQQISTATAPILCGGLIAASISLTGGGTTTEKTHSPSTHSSPTFGGAVAVKIDNVSPARPSVGVAKAKVVYVEQVEGGLSRMMAIFGSDDLPQKLGPVRSAREADLEVLKQYGKVEFAYSGATHPLLPWIDKANVCNYSHAKAGYAYYRDNTNPNHWAPHNLYVNPTKLKGCGATELSLPIGKAPAGGVADSSAYVSYPAAKYRFAWNGKNYDIFMDGKQASNYDTGNEHASTVIVQHVHMDKAVHGSPKTPFTRTVGSGDAQVYRDGKRFDGKWSRTDASNKTQYTVNGKDIPFADGQTWILLVG